jgi:hypothetical protein
MEHMKKIVTGVFLIITTSVLLGSSCSKTGVNTPDPVPPVTTTMNLELKKINNQVVSISSVQLPANEAVLQVSFSAKINRSTANAALAWNSSSGSMPLSITYVNGDSVMIIQPSAPLNFLTQYTVAISDQLKSVNGAALSSSLSLSIRTGIDPSNKFPPISENALLDTVQRRTFKYFWEYGHPVSGMARDKTNTSELDDCSVGGTGFGILCVPVAINRNFITRADGLARMQKIVDFLKVKAKKFHGAFPHRINGATGSVIEWSPKDDGADLVETSFLMMGLLTARQYFNGANVGETNLRTEINTLYNNVEWTWFQRGGQNALYWLWSPTHNWDITFMIRGWNETLITYIMAAASTTNTISKQVYDNGFANNGGFKSGQPFYGLTLPLGSDFGGPLFLSQYSFLCINPTGLSDTYANYALQTKNHTLINRAYCIENPKNYFGYSDSCWGLSASSTHTGYTAASPSNDVGVITPTAALSSFAFTPNESMAALKYFYYRLGNYLWKDYGFVDAFNLTRNPVWVGPQELVYNQLPIMISIENYRSGLIWDLFVSCPEVKAGMRKLGFAAPYL